MNHIYALQDVACCTHAALQWKHAEDVLYIVTALEVVKPSTFFGHTEAEVEELNRVQQAKAVTLIEKYYAQCTSKEVTNVVQLIFLQPLDYFNC
jgi:hypothetical protein